MISLEQRNKILYQCNKEDMIKKCFIDYHSDNEIDYIDKSIAYFLKYRLNGRQAPRDESIYHLIYTLQKELSLVVAQKQLSGNPDEIKNMENNVELKKFFKDPVNYVYTKLSNDEYYESIKPKSFDFMTTMETNGYLKKMDKGREDTLGLLSVSNAQVRYTAVLNEKMVNKEVYNLIQRKYPPQENIIDIQLRRQKRGIFESLFFRSSQYKTFNSVFNKFRNNTGGVNQKDLKDAAWAYLKHKFPNLKEGEVPTEEQVAHLVGKSKGRTEMCLRVYKSIIETEQAKKVLEDAKAFKLDDEVKEVKDNNISKEIEKEMVNTNVIQNEIKEEEINTNVIQNEIKEEEISTTTKTNIIPNEIKKEEAAPKVNKLVMDKPKRGILKSRGTRANRNNNEINSNSNRARVRIQLPSKKVPNLTSTKGGPKNVPLNPNYHPDPFKPKQRKERPDELLAVKEEKAFKEEQKALEAKKVLATDNKAFVDNLKKETNENFAANKTEEIDTSTTNQIENNKDAEL